MSYDIYVNDSDGEPVILSEVHDFKGGLQAVGGTDEAWLNVTYNYGKFYHQLWEDGLHGWDGKPVQDFIPELERGVAELGTDHNGNLYEATAGNAGFALQSLLHICRTAAREHPHKQLVIEVS